MGSKQRKRTSGNPARAVAVQGQRPPTRPAAHQASVFETSGIVGDIPQSGSALYRRSADAPTRRTVRDRAGQTLADRVILDLPVHEEQSLPSRCGVLLDFHPHTVAATYRLQTPSDGGPWELAVRFKGVLSQTEQTRPAHRDSFDVTECEPVVANGQRVALTVRVPQLEPGLWRVAARGRLRSLADGSARQTDLPQRVIQTSSRYGLLAHGPRVRLWTWPALVALGTLAALLVQFTLVRSAGYDAFAVLGLSLLGCLFGFAGGRLWCLGLHRRPLSEFLTVGACIQGFLLVALAVLALGSLARGLPVGRILDLSSPGVFLAVALARPGCFLTGCCAGRPTSSRLGLISSDRRIMLRRYPVQLLEALTGLTIGIVSLLLVWRVEPAIDGAIFLAAVAAYVLARQALFRLRVESRTAKGRLVTTLVAATALLTAMPIILSV